VVGKTVPGLPAGTLRPDANDGCDRGQTELGVFFERSLQPIQHLGINFLDRSQADLKFHGVVDLGGSQTSANLAHGEHLRKDQPGSNRNQPISPPKNRVPQRPLREIPFPSTWVG
jgi:hypothetical protein